MLVVRPFGAGLRQDAPPSGATAGFVLLALATVSFDGIAETPFWEDIVGGAMRLLYDAGIVPANRLHGGRAAWSRPSASSRRRFSSPPSISGPALSSAASPASPCGLTARRYVLSLVPIAVAYHLAHYLSYLLIQGQAVWPLLSDPLNLGWDLFGTRGYEIDIGVVGMRFVWLFAVAAIVVGHVAAVTLAHVEALRVASRADDRRGEPSAHAGSDGGLYDAQPLDFVPADRRRMM